MKEGYSIRWAIPGDIGFITETIIAAEKSGTTRIGIANLFGLTKDKLTDLLIQILNEESSGNEFSLNCYLVAVYEGQPVAAMAGWIENFGDDIPSRKAEANLIQYFFPVENIRIAQSGSDIVKGIAIDRAQHALQIENVFTSEQHRGKGLIKELINTHISIAKQIYPGLAKVQVQAFKNNISAIRAYERAGFTIVRSYKSDNPETLAYYPDEEKMLMERIIN